MNKHVASPLPMPQTLVEQKSDFTAEGAPLPGMVSTSEPVSSPDHEKTPTHSTRMRGTIKLKRASSDRSP